MTELFRPLEYKVGGSTLRIEYCDIVTTHTDVIVSSDDVDISMGGGVSHAILKAGGESILSEAQAFAPLDLGNIAVTSAGHLTAKHIFHTAVLDYKRPKLTTVDLIRTTARKCLVVCKELGFQSIAFPALATGAARLSPERSAVAMMLEIVEQANTPKAIPTIVIAIFPRRGLDRKILTQFYARIEGFLEYMQKLKSVSHALAGLELLYREFHISEAAADAAESHRILEKTRLKREDEMLSKDPVDLADEYDVSAFAWDPDIESELDRIAALSKWQKDIEKAGALLGQERLVKLETQYQEYRVPAVYELISIHAKNISDLEVESASRGFSLEINRRLEQEKSALEAVKDELVGFGLELPLFC